LVETGSARSHGKGTTLSSAIATIANAVATLRPRMRASATAAKIESTNNDEQTKTRWRTKKREEGNDSVEHGVKAGWRSKRRPKSQNSE
jgi:hypothetical protein